LVGVRTPTNPKTSWFVGVRMGEVSAYTADDGGLAAPFAVHVAVAQRS